MTIVSKIRLRLSESEKGIAYNRIHLSNVKCGKRPYSTREEQAESFENSHNYINMSTFERCRNPDFSQAPFWQFLSSHATHLSGSYLHFYIITWVVAVIVLNNNFKRE